MWEIYKFYNDGGWFMHPILIIAIFALATIIERIYYIMGRYNINGAEFMAQVQKLVLANNIDRAIKLCNRAPSAALAKVVKAGLTRANRGEIEVQNAVDEATLEVLPELQKRTNYLSVYANVATLLGLLGTIMGLIDAFDAIDAADAAQRSSALARGISVAMNTTAFGLIVAIPAMMVHATLQSSTIKIIDEIDQYSVKLINLLSARERRAPGAASGEEGDGT